MLLDFIVDLTNGLKERCQDEEAIMEFQKVVVKYCTKLIKASQYNKDVKRLFGPNGTSSYLIKERSKLDFSNYIQVRYWRAVYSYCSDEIKLCHFCRELNSCYKRRMPKPCNLYSKSLKAISSYYKVKEDDVILVFLLEDKNISELKSKAKEADVKIANLDPILEKMISHCDRISRSKLRFVWYYNNYDPEDMSQELLSHIYRSLLTYKTSKRSELERIAFNSMRQKAAALAVQFTAKKRTRLISEDNNYQSTVSSINDLDFGIEPSHNYIEDLKKIVNDGQLKLIEAFEEGKSVWAFAKQNGIPKDLVYDLGYKLIDLMYGGVSYGGNREKTT